MRYIIAAFMLAFSASAIAQHSFEIRWNDPTARVDGQPFDAATEVGLYVIQCSADEAFTAPLEEVFERSQTVADGAGRYFLWADAVQVGGWYYCRLNVADTDGLVSDWSAVVSVRKQAKPNPPVLRP